MNGMNGLNGFGGLPPFSMPGTDNSLGGDMSSMGGLGNSMGNGMNMDATSMGNGMGTGMGTSMGGGMGLSVAPPRPVAPRAPVPVPVKYPGGKGGASADGMSDKKDFNPPFPQAPRPPFMGNPSVADLAKAGAAAFCSGKTIADNEVKVQDPSGRVMQEFPRYETFDQAPFPPVVQAALKKAGFPAPSQIQQYCWPLACQGKDVIGVAATGSGKTISFLLPAFTSIMNERLSADRPALCVLAPTRELAIQIQEEADKFGKPDIRSVCCYGGAPKHGQADEIRRGIHGVIGTPGRINDFIEGGQLDLSRVSKLVLDEADRMLDMGFEPQIRKILAKIPSHRHTMFFTATWPQSVRRLANEFLRGAFTVTIGNRDELKGNQDITQSLQSCRGHEKNGICLGILRQAGVADKNNGDAKALVFCGTKRMCDQLTQWLERNGVPCAAVHGDKGQRDREAALNGLKEGRLKTLVATDVAARGLDIKGVTLVINYDPPGHKEDYVHRIGRTGRAGQKGHAVALISERDTHALRGIIEVMKRTNQQLTPEFEEMSRNAPAPPPSGRAARGGPPPVTVDPNFKPGLSSGGFGTVEMPRDTVGGLNDGGYGKGGGKGSRDFGRMNSYDSGKGGGSRDFNRGGSFRDGGDFRRRSPPRRRSPSRRRRSPSRRRDSRSRRRDSRSRSPPPAARGRGGSRGDDRRQRQPSSSGSSRSRSRSSK